MTEPTAPAVTASDMAWFPSLASMRAAHTDLLKLHHAPGQPPEMTTEIEAFIQRGTATGALLDSEADRATAQSQLDYWATRLFQPGRELPDATLVDFDPMQAPILDDALCPYVGLEAFHETNTHVFFGRQRLVRELLNKLQIQRFLAVVGASGSGKSSVVRAGLVPALKNGGLAGNAAWICLPPFVPGSNPLVNLARLILPDAPVAQIEAEADRFRQDPAHLTQLVAAQFEHDIVLVIDQFEEIFTLCDEDMTRQRFVANLIGLSQSPTARHRVIITMRTDFETYVARLPDVQALFEQSVVRLTPLNAAELREAIEAPAASIGLKFEEGVVAALLNDTLGEPAALPLLQFTLLKLWDHRERNRITWEAYRRLGGGRQALARTADEFYSRLIPEEQVTMRRILLRMVRPGEGLEVTSNRVLRAALYQRTEAPDRIDRVLDKLIKARLVRVSEGDTAMDEQVEIAHEALVRNWPRLVEWVEEERVTLRQRQRLTAAAEQWQRLGRDSSAVWRGALLDETRRYDDLNELETEFVEAGHAAERAEQARQLEEVRRQQELEYTQMLAQTEIRSNRRLRWLAAGLMATLVLFIIATILVVVQSNEAKHQAAEAARQAEEARHQEQIASDRANELEHESRIARSRALLSQGQSLAKDLPLLSARLMLEALAVAPEDDQATQSTAETTLRTMVATGLASKLSDKSSISFRRYYGYPDRMIIAYLDAPGIFRSIDNSVLVTLTGVISTSAYGSNFFSWFSPDRDGTYFVVSYTDAPPELRRSVDGALIAAFPGARTVYFPGRTSLSDANDLTVEVYYPDRPPELRRASDGALLKTFDKAASIYTFGLPSPYYLDNADDSLYNSVNGSVIPGSGGNVTFSPDRAYFASGGGSSALYRADTGANVAQLGPIDHVYFGYGDPNSYDGPHFPISTSTHLVVGYRDQAAQLRRIQGGELVSSLTDKIRGTGDGQYFTGEVVAFAQTPAISNALVAYQTAPGELRSLIDGSVIVTLTGQVHGFYRPTATAPNVIVAYEDRPGEIRRIADGSVVITLTNIITADESNDDLLVMFSAGPTATYFVVNYNRSPSELRRTADGSLITKLRGDRFGGVKASYAVFDESDTYVAVEYTDGQAEVRRTSDGSIAIPSTRASNVNLLSDSETAYAFIRSPNSGELWQLDTPPRLIGSFDLGIRYLFLDKARGQIIASYQDGRTYTGDLGWLKAVAGAAAQLSRADLARLVCRRFAADESDAALLQSYLGGSPAEACTSGASSP